MIFALLAILPAPASAQILVGENLPITTAAGFQSGPAVAANPTSGEFLVVWHDDRPFGPTGGSDIFGQRVSSAGSLIGENLAINNGGSAAGPDVVFNSMADEFFVVYSGGIPSCCIFGQRVAADGTQIGAEILISPINTSSSSIRPTIAYNSLSSQFPLADL